MEIQEKILTHLSAYGKENKYRLARALKTDVAEVTQALDALEKEGKIEIKEGNAMLIEGKKPESVEPEQEEKIEEEIIEEQKVEELPEEHLEKEISEEIPTEKETQEERIEEEKFEGTVKFYNTNKGFGFITGDNGKDYRVYESGLKEGVTIKADDRVSFNIVLGFKGPEAVDVEKVSESAGVQKIILDE